VTGFNQQMKVLGINKTDMVCWKFAAGQAPCNGVTGTCRVDSRRKRTSGTTRTVGMKMRTSDAPF
jgi:hypothetical protein